MVGCSEDYTDWADPQRNDPETAKTVTLTVSPAAAIDFATVTTDSVQLFIPTVAVSDVATNNYTVVLNSPDGTSTQTITAVENGIVSVSELETAYYNLVGRNPIERTIALDISAYTNVNGQSIKSVGSTTATLTANAPVIYSQYYIVGNVNGWNNADTSIPLSNGGGDQYADPTFTATFAAPESGNVEFKIFPAESMGDWNATNIISATADDAAGKFSYANEGGNLVIEAQPNAKYYRVTFDMLNGTWSYVALNFSTFIYEIGNESSWSTSHALYGANSDGNYLGYYYLDGEFKFKPNADNWDGDWEYDGEGKIADNGGPNVPDPGAGYYRISVNLANMTYSLQKVESISMIGTVNGNWNNDTDLTYNTSTGNWEWTGHLDAGEVKFRVNHDWAISWGGKSGNTDYDNLTENNGANLQVAEAGIYKVTLIVHQENGDCKVSIVKQ